MKQLPDSELELMIIIWRAERPVFVYLRMRQIKEKQHIKKAITLYQCEK